MKLLVLALSAATNLGLVITFASKPALAPPGVRSLFDFSGGTTAEPPAAASSRGAVKRPAAKKELWSQLHSEELPTLVAKLRAAGFPATMVRAIVEAELERRFGHRLKDLTRTLAETPYWKPDPSYYMGNSRLFEEISQIYRERSRMLRDLLGKDALAYGMMDPSAAQRRQYGNLSQQKIDLVRRIVDDYAEMTSQIRVGMQGIALPEDREKLALLEREKRADLLAVLTPEELADYDMRTSPTASRLRTTFTVMDATEDEFRKIYAIYQPFAEVLYPTGITMFTMEMSEQRREAQRKVNEQVKGVLGEPRFAEYQRASSSEFQQLYRLAQRDNVPYDTIVRAYDTRAPAAEASQKIRNDPTLSFDQKRDALKQLATTSRTQLLSTLGPSVGPAYVESARWLSYLEQGGTFTVMPDGNLSFSSLPRPAPTPAPKK